MEEEILSKRFEMQFGPQRHAMVRIWFTFLGPFFFFFSNTCPFISGVCLLITVHLFTDNLLFNDHPDQTIQNQTVTHKKLSVLQKLTATSYALLWSVFVGKLILFGEFSPVARTKTTENTDENGGFRRCFQSKASWKRIVLKTPIFLAWIGENKLTEAFENDAGKSVKCCRFEQRFWSFKCGR